MAYCGLRLDANSQLSLAGTSQAYITCTYFDHNCTSFKLLVPDQLMIAPYWSAHCYFDHTDLLE